METIKQFLSSPKEYEDELWEGDALVWVDWREYDEDIIHYFNEKLPDAHKIIFECVEIEKERGIDIILKKNGVHTAIPYADAYTDRDTTLRSIQEYVSPEYQIRWYLGSLGSDTLAFGIFPITYWNQLEQEFGTKTVAYYFAPINADSMMFEMDMNEIEHLLEKRGNV